MPRIINLATLSDDELLALYKKALEKDLEYINELIELTEQQKQVEADYHVTEEQVEDGSINQGEYMEAMHDIGQQFQMYKRLIEAAEVKLDKNQQKIDTAVAAAQRRGLRKPRWEYELRILISDKIDVLEWLKAT